MEELTNNEMINVEEELEAIEAEDQNETSVNLGKVVLGAAVASTGVGAIGLLLYKNRDKIRARRLERQAERLRRNGYLVERTEELEEVYDSDEGYSDEE